LHYPINKKMKKKIILSLLVFIVVFMLIGVAKVKAGTTDNTLGWLWGGSSDGATPAIMSGVGWISMNNVNSGAGGTVSYGLVVPTADGDITGYLWSENIGWISFNAADLAGCPNGNCVSRKVGNDLMGWDRIVGIENEAAVNNSGGWQGWIKLGGTAQKGETYGVSVSNGVLQGYAWSDELGAIRFDGANVLCLPDYTSYSCSLIETGIICDQSNCNQTIIGKTAVCSRIDNNNCLGDPLPTNQDCADNGVTCPADVTKDCGNSACSLQTGGWREVAP
jgi:hypothetical protein